MSQVGKTQLRGHGLRREGAVTFLADGTPWFWYPQPGQEFHAACGCGALSPAGISQNAAKRWHREHKDAVRALSAPQSDAQGEREHGDGTTAQGSAQGDVGGQG